MKKSKLFIGLMMAAAITVEFIFGAGTGMVIATSALLVVKEDDTDEVKKAKQALIAAKDAAVEKAKELLKGAISPDSEEFKSAVSAILEKSLESITVKHGDKDMLIKDAFESMQKQFDELATKFSEGGKEKDKVTFKAAFANSLEATKDRLASFAKKSTEKMDETIELKDMDFDNFSEGALDILTSQTLPGVYANPWSQLWLRNIFPNATTEAALIKYLQEDAEANEDNGAADIWDGSLPIDELLAKPDVDFSFTDKSAEVQWIAGVTRIKREMLDDIAFLRSYIPQQLVYGKRGILVRENTLILSTMNTNSVAYNGSQTVLVEQLIDAAFGQLVDNYHQPTHILMNNREALQIIFNKATGSGEYDLPAGVQVTPLGTLTIGGVPVIGLPQFAEGTAFVVDARQSLFVSRMSPEVRFFEQDRDNVIKNLITIRAEERAAHLVFDPSSIVKVSQTT